MDQRPIRESDEAFRPDDLINKNMTNHKIIGLLLFILLLTGVSITCPAQNSVAAAIDATEGKAGFNLVNLGPGRIKLMAALTKDKEAKKNLKRFSAIRILNVPMGSEGDSFLNSLESSAKESYMHLINVFDENTGEYDLYLMFSDVENQSSLTPEALQEMPQNTMLKEILVIRPFARVVMLMTGDIPISESAWSLFTNP